MDAAHDIRQALARGLAACDIEFDAENVPLEHPSQFEHGDYASGIALAMAKEVGVNPRELAEKIVAGMGTVASVSRIEIAGPGFINFHLAPGSLAAAVTLAMVSETWGSSSMYAGKRCVVEHSSPNLFKPFHIGHLVNNALGESIVRLMRSTGAEVTTMSYPSDVSPGIAKAVWGLIDKGWQHDPTMQQIAEAYAWGSRQYEDDEAAKKEIDRINLVLYRQEPSHEFDVYFTGRSLTLARFREDARILGSSFDITVFESEAEKVGKDIVQSHVPDVFEKSDGAIIYRGSADGLYDDVFINSAGYCTYLGKDIGLLDIKFNRLPFTPDMSITVTDIEQERHFMLLSAAARRFMPQNIERSRFVHHGRLKFPEGKISSRLGNVPLASDVLAEVMDEVQEKMSERVHESKQDETVQQIAVGAIKFTILRAQKGRNLVFDPSKALSIEGDSGPYLQYAYARACSILMKAEEADVTAAADESRSSNTCERLVSRFPEIVQRAVRELEPHHVAQYLLELAGAFNSWYAQEQILDGTDAAAHKVAVTAAVARTLERGLWMLGIPSPEHM